jgi:hypothetical protein
MLTIPWRRRKSSQTYRSGTFDNHHPPIIARTSNLDTRQRGCREQRLKTLAPCAQPAILVDRDDHGHSFAMPRTVCGPSFKARSTNSAKRALAS